MATEANAAGNFESRIIKKLQWRLIPFFSSFT